MKKIKLITPILGLATMSSSLIPLTSCNQGKNLGITKEQWTNAFAMVQDPWNENRNFTIDGKVYSYDEEEGKLVCTDGYKVQAVKGATLGIDLEGETESEDSEYYYSVIHDGVIWSYDQKLSTDKPEPQPIHPMYNIYLENPTLMWMDLLAGMFIDMYDQLIRLDDLKFRLNIVNANAIQGYCDFEFDSNYKVKTISGNMDLILQDETAFKLGKVDLAFSNYGSTTVNFSEDSFDYSKMLFKGQQQTDKFVIELQDLDKNYVVFGFDMPEDLSITNLKNINITSTDDISDIGLVLNNKDLVKGVDYTYNETDKKIVLKSALSKNDKLRIIIETFTASNWKLELVKAE